jgi:periplasmic copper chaperone A
LKLRPIAAAVAAGALIVPAAASAHVTLQPKAQTAGAYTVVAVRVPNEQDKASTTKIKVDFPDGIYGVSYMPKAGWKTTVKMAKLATPVQTEDGPITTQVGSVTFTGTGKGLGAIAPGQFQEFPLSLQMPNTPGATLTFPAYQWYSNGDLVKWTGPAGAETPAPTISLAAPVSALAAPLAQAAHAPVVSRTPGPGTTASNVTSVNVTFGEGVVTGLISVTKGGKTVATKSTGLTKKNTVLQATFAKKLAKGAYTVNWRARADDGHSEKGTWSFNAR